MQLAVFKDIQLFLVDSFNHSDVQVAKSGADAKARLVSLDFKVCSLSLSQVPPFFFSSALSALRLGSTSAVGTAEPLLQHPGFRSRY